MNGPDPRLTSRTQDTGSPPKDASKLANLRASTSDIAKLREQVPGELLSLARWVCWDGTRSPLGKLRKTPLNPHTGGNAQSNNSTTWSSFDDAAAFALADKRAGGLAFSLKASGYWALDFDHVIDTQTGEVAPPARRLLDALSATYAERSISRDGLHVIYKGDRPASLSRTTAAHAFGQGRHLEVFGGESGRFLIMTGDAWKL